MFRRRPSRGWPFLLLSAVLLPAAPLVHAGERPLRQVIDAEVKAAWQRQKLTAAGRCDDAAFLRRAFLDLVGTVPTHDDARAFLQDAAPDRRAKLIDRLLADPRFAEHQADVWDLVFFGRNPPNADAVRKRDGFRKWLAGRFAANVPYDRWVREMLRAGEEGSESFLVQFRNQPEEATVAVSRLFLGTQLQCARCHDHPFARWTQKDFYGMTGFFVRLVVYQRPGNKGYAVGEKSTGEVLFSGSAKEQRPGRRGEPVRAKFLGGPVLDEPPVPKGFKEPPLRGNKPPAKPLFSRKEKLAAWVTAPDNPYFARAAANRLWAQFMGHGLVHPIDDLGGKNEPSHPELLDAIAGQLKVHQFDLKWLIRELVLSEAYQLAAAGPGTEALPQWFERARVRPLSAEELLAALRTATGFDNGQTRRADARLPGAIKEYFRIYFGSPTNGLGDFQGSLAEHLFLNNSDQIRALIRRRKGNLADLVLSSKEPWEARVDRLFLSVLSRLPKPAERRRFVAHLTSSPKPEALVEEAIWVLLNCSEFRFNH